MAKQTKVVKAKKRWFAVIAPEIFKHKEVGDVAAFEQTELIGRTVEISASKLTDTPKDQHRKIVLQISDVTGDKVTSVVKRMFFLDKKIQREIYHSTNIAIKRRHSKDKSLSNGS